MSGHGSDILSARSAFGRCRSRLAHSDRMTGASRRKLLEVRAAQLAEASRAEWREPQAHDPMVDRVGVPVDETGLDRAVDEPDHAVVPEQQRIGNVADRRSFAVRMASDREQQLVLRRRDADGRRLLFAPPKKLAQPGSEVEQSPVVIAVRLVILGHHDIVLRYVAARWSPLDTS